MHQKKESNETLVAMLHNPTFRFGYMKDDTLLNYHCLAILPELHLITRSWDDLDASNLSRANLSRSNLSRANLSP
jgi:uncharacterized protein YjbI with pentapeptide repeats